MDSGFRLFPEQASTIGGRVDSLYFFLLLIAAFFTLLIFLSIVFLAMYYRRGATRNRNRTHSDRAWILEVTWIAIPLALVMFIFGWGANIYFDEHTVPPNSIELHVVAKQWMWKIQHPQGRSEINELHIPTGRPIQLQMVSQDVIHSFYVPEFRVKKDVLPGRYTSMWFEATKPGTYHLFCAEYCGTGHAIMRGRVVVMAPAEYAQWLSGGEQQPPVSAGEELFTRFRCNTCHFQGAQQPRGPSLANLYGQPVKLSTGQIVTADDEYLRESILNPPAKVVAGFQPIMPTFQNQLSEEQVFQLIQYIKSLSTMPQKTSGAAATGQVDQSPQQPSAASPAATPPLGGKAKLEQ
jgi:cytochrome c oxidase subunit 2